MKTYEGPEDWTQEELARLDKWAGDIVEASSEYIDAYWRNPRPKHMRFTESGGVRTRMTAQRSVSK